MIEENNRINIKFPKKEKLCKEKDISMLFTSGKSFISYPLRVVFLQRKTKDEDPSQLSVLVSVSKRKFKRAVKRNKVKRLMRESFRLNKSLFYDHIKTIESTHIDIAFIYLSEEIVSFAEMEKAMRKASMLFRQKMEIL